MGRFAGSSEQGNFMPLAQFIDLKLRLAAMSTEYAEIVPVDGKARTCDLNGADAGDQLTLLLTKAILNATR
jgi:hypothetical protein